LPFNKCDPYIDTLGGIWVDVKAWCRDWLIFPPIHENSLDAAARDIKRSDSNLQGGKSLFGFLIFASVYFSSNFK
jgi:hypothetical protein